MKKNPNRPDPKPLPAPAPELRFARGPVAYLAASILLLVPCFWQSRLQAGDLSSHLYNAWLVQLIERGQAPGLTIASQTTNLLFDWLLSWAFRAFGPEAAQRIAVSLAVLTFVWGAFAFVSVAAKRRVWNLLPWIVLLAYGWVFHMGFFNFYLSLGLCFFALALAWDWDVRRLAGAAALLAVAYLAHSLPVLWAGGVLVYVWVERRAGPKNRMKLLGAAIAAIVVLRLILGTAMLTIWSPGQIALITGLDQLFVFDNKYLPAVGGALLLWILLLRRLTGIWRGILVQVCLLTAAGIVILPTGVLVPGYGHGLAYVAERMSLALAVCICAVLAAAPARPYDRYLTGAVALLFFGLLYRDVRLLNGFEDRMTALVAQLPASQRVIGGIEQTGLRINALAHMIDRICVGRCYSYANYEPSTGQFRVRVNGDNPIVAPTYQDSLGLQSGSYVVKERDLPLYQLLVNESGQLQIRVPPAGFACGVTAWNVL